MKISRIVLAVLFALAASANTLRAVPSLPTFSFHENGNGQLELPSLMFSNTVTIPENPSGPTIYNPGEGQPGFSTDSPLGDSFLIFSTPDTGSTLLMLGAAIAGFVFLRWKMPAV